jgi:hypothetical protein
MKLGIIKQMMLEEESMGWDRVGDKNVCNQCFGDYAIKKFICDNSTSTICDYCGRESENGNPIAANFDKVMELIIDGIEYEWADPNDDGVGWESREGGWQCKVYDSWDLLHDVIADELEIDYSTIFDQIAWALCDRQWCEKDHLYLRPHKRMICNWEAFCKAVKYETRYMFFEESKEDLGFRHPDDIPPSETLELLSAVIKELGLIKTIESRQRFYRVRVHDKSEICKTVAELGPPSREKARFANRMSPAGIPMFYGAQDLDTAIAETFNPDKGKNVNISACVFETIPKLNLLDFSDLPPFPSLFDKDHRPLRPAILFFRKFINDLSQPIQKDGREHIEYVPTQIITEFFRYRLKTDDGQPVHGMLYPSSRYNGGICCVFFCTQENCSPSKKSWMPHEQWLALDQASVICKDAHELFDS